MSNNYKLCGFGVNDNSDIINGISRIDLRQDKIANGIVSNVNEFDGKKCTWKI